MEIPSGGEAAGPQGRFAFGSLAYLMSERHGARKPYFLVRALENLINAWLGGQRKKDGRRDASAACGHSTARLLAKFRHLSAGGRSVRLDPAIPVGELARFLWL